MDTKTFLHIIDVIADQNNTTSGEVYREMEKAIHAAITTGDARSKKELMAIPHEGDVPTPYEVVSHISQKLSKSSCVASCL